MIARIKPGKVPRIKPSQKQEQGADKKGNSPPNTSQKRTPPQPSRRAPPAGIYNQAVQCSYCEHWYLSPCSRQDSSEEARDRCPNWQHLQDARLIDHLAGSKKVKRVKA